MSLIVTAAKAMVVVKKGDIVLEDKFGSGTELRFAANEAYGLFSPAVKCFS